MVWGGDIVEVVVVVAQSVASPTITFERELYVGIILGSAHFLIVRFHLARFYYG